MSPFRLSAPLDGQSPLILSSPHSGTYLPPAFRARLPLAPQLVRRLEDAHVGQLLEAASRHAPLIEATHARAVIDLNRGEDEIDAATVEGGPPLSPTARGRAGFGLFPRHAAPGHPLIRRPLARHEAEARIAALHRPWHRAIAEGLAAARARHGGALLLDCHSMPPLEAGGAQVVLGDRFGRSASPRLVDLVEGRLRAAGLRTARNHPYAGGHGVTRHGRPAYGVHAIQIELCRNLYMNIGNFLPHEGFSNLSEILADLCGELVEMLGGGLAVAAE
jgi:N-formylglutamate deformylase